MADSRKRDRAYRQASRLWDLADHAANGEALWAELVDTCPWAFHDRQDVNSILRNIEQAVFSAHHKARKGW